jgi:hypothetical protein
MTPAMVAVSAGARKRNHATNCRTGAGPIARRRLQLLREWQERS